MPKLPFRWFANLKIGVRVLSGLLLLTCGLLWLAGEMLVERYATVQDMQRVGRLADLAPTVSALVHELQKERGRSAGFIGSKGELFADVLPGQRQETDKTLKALTGALETFDFSDYGQALRDRSQQARQRLDELTAKRAATDDFALTVPQMAEYYTGTIMSLLSIVEAMLQASDIDDVSKQIGAYISFLHGKERAGRERAMGAGGFGAGAFQPAIYNNLVRLIGAQDIFFDRFRLYGTDADRNFFEKTMTGPAVDEVARMRDIAIRSSQSGDLGGMTAGAWFEQITEKINLMAQVENEIGASLQRMAEQNQNAAWRSLQLQAVALILLLLAVGLLTAAVVRSITAPVNALTDVMHRLAKGDKSVEVCGTDRGDELGAMAKAVEVFRENAIRMEQMEIEQAEQKNREAAQRREQLLGLADDFEANVSEVVEAVTKSAGNLQHSAESLAGTAQQSSEQSANVASASQQATGNVQAVASATEELSASVQEIGRQVVESTNISASAVEEADRVGNQMKDLAEASQRIGEVVNLINDIAEQTNLLALNATIEAARAGEAGKGFAVVASEVKNLATQTAKATGQIAEQVTSMQNATNSSVTAIEGVATTIRRISEIASAISAAVEEQSAATNEIGANVQDAARGTQQVDENISFVSEGARETGTAADEVLSAARDMTRQSDALQAKLNDFLSQIRAA